MRVLFLGNSYTYVNNTPLLTSLIAQSMGDTLVYGVNAIGGYTLQDHLNDAVSISLIEGGGWDYIILQEQSQLPLVDDILFAHGVLPYILQLDSIIKLYNPCGQTMFYRTWPNKHGSLPSPLYELGDSMLRLRYNVMADSCHAEISPVGSVWHYIRHNYPAINLYQADDSHPTMEGSYAAACSFYTALFRKDPTLNSYNPGIDTLAASEIRFAAKSAVYDSQQVWHIGEYHLEASFTSSLSMDTLYLYDNSTAAANYYWDFGDGSTSTLKDPVHQYAGFGSYLVKLIVADSAGHCADTSTALFVFSPSAVPKSLLVNAFSVEPNPVQANAYVRSSHFLQHKCNIQVYDILGYLRYSTVSDAATKQELDLTQLSPGMYYLLVYDGNDIYRQTVLKK